MFVITNRNVDPDAKGLDRLGDRPNPKGPNELRIVEAKRKNDDWNIDILNDELADDQLHSIGLQREFDAQGNPIPVYASRYAAHRILERVNPKHPEIGKKRGTGCNLLFFVHGYNNDIKAVLDRAEGFEKNFGVEVVAFSWPANGGGLRGTASYLSDKRDARASVGALDRALKKMYDLLNDYNQREMTRIVNEADRKFGNDLEKRDIYITEHSQQVCRFNITFVAHSMGNYVYKNLLKSTSNEGNQLLFDNVVLAAADTNNEGHASWVDTIRARRRIFITINEDDHALRVSRLKTGSEQLARLGHYPYNLYSTRSVYVDFTNVAHVRDSHAYFEGRSLNNDDVKQFFHRAFNGEPAEEDLKFDSATQMHRFKR